MTAFDQRVTSVIRTVLTKLLKREVNETVVAGLYEFVKFGIVGLSNTFLSYLIYLLAWQALTSLSLSGAWRYQLANLLAFLLAVLWSFYWNNKLVFKDQSKSRSLWSALLKTYVSYSVTGLLLNSLLLILWVDVLQMSELVAPLLNLVISVPINFLLNKFWAFK